LKPEPQSIAIVDDDESVRESLTHLLKELGFRARAFQSAEDFLASGFFRETDCLILDVAMKGMSGPQLQVELRRLGLKVPIVFITGQIDQSLRLKLLEQGAVDCLLKPFSDASLLQALNRALHLS